jgi:malate dehydrogenase
VFIAIVGAGPIGAAIAQRLAERGTAGEVKLIDELADVAAGKALDILQAGPIDGYTGRVTAAADPLAAIGAEVVVIADRVEGGEWAGDSGVRLLRTLTAGGSTSPIVFAGPTQLALAEDAYRVVGIPAKRLLATAPGATVSAARALAGLELNLSRVDLAVVGRPPAFVPGWSAASTAGSLLSDRVPPHRLLAIGDSVRQLWPPGAQAIAAVTAEIAHALVHGSRALHFAATIVDGDLGARGAAVLLPLEIGRGRVIRYVMPSLSPQERTDLLRSIPDPAQS